MFMPNLCPRAIIRIRQWNEDAPVNKGYAVRVKTHRLSPFFAFWVLSFWL